MRIPHVRYVILGLMLLVLISPGSAIDQEALSNVPDNAYPARYAEQGTAELSDQPYANDEILIRFTPGAESRAAASRLHAQIGASVKKDFTPYGLERLQVVKIPGRLTVPEAIEHYTRNPNVLYAEPNYVVQAADLPDDDLFNELWGLHNTGQTGGTSDCDIDAPEAWDLTHGSSDVIVAVIDTGVDYNHPDLAANIWANTDEIAGVAGIDDDNNGYIDDVVGWDFANDDNAPMDDNGHGTHCAGTIGAVGNNGIGVTGVMWTAQIMPLKFLGADGSGYTDDALSAVLYANEKGAHVISNSWGGGGFSQALKDAIDQSTAVVPCAAGNNRKNTDRIPHYPSSYTSEQIIAVAATDNEDDLASFSNYGIISVDVAAPGVNILSTYPGGYARKSGTSMATPHVAGLAGAIKAYYPNMSNTEIKERIMATVDQDAALARKIASGGRINAYSALESTSIDPPTASFTVDTESGVAPLTVQFTDTSTGTIDAWDWDFGDGDSSTEQNPTHTYTVAKTYTVQLTVSNAAGSSTTIPGTQITVTQAEPVLTSIVVSPASATLDIGDAQLFTATGYDQYDAVMPVTATWSSTNTGVATIDPSGMLTAVGAGTCTVTATSADVSGSATVTVNPAGTPLPTITSLDPGSLTAGSAKFKLTVGGMNFVSGAKVLWNGAERKTTYLSSTQLQAWILRPDVAKAGSYPVTVRNPDGKLSDAVSFTVL